MLKFDFLFSVMVFFFLECEFGLFGVNCSFGCGYCLKNKFCYFEIGVCFEGCELGYRGNNCKKSNDNCLYVN